jgi:hypothetical protein
MQRVAITVLGRRWTPLAEAVPRAEFALVNAPLVLFAVGRERTKAYSILVPTSGLTLLRRLFHPLWGDKNCRVGNSRKS